MSKIRIKVTLITPEKVLENEYNAIFHSDENTIVYQEKDKTITKINKDELRLRRENDKLLMEYEFKNNMNTIAKVFSKELSKLLELNIKTSEIINSDKNIEITYKLENEDYKYKIEVL